MKWLVLSALAVPALALAQQPTRSTSTGFSVVAATDARVDRVEQWLNAIAHHDPGFADESSRAIAAWPNADLQSLWIDLNTLTALIAKPATGDFMINGARGQRATRVFYAEPQLRRMRALACAAAGVELNPLVANNEDGHRLCRDRELGVLRQLSDGMKRLSALAARARALGDVNFTAKHGAFLHSDIAMAGPLAAEPINAIPTLAPQGYVVNTADGRPINTSAVAVHWEIARMLLDQVRPSDTAHPAPSRDGTVRAWYRATTAWMQLTDHLYASHVEHGLAHFPRDADLLFLLGCLHETFADTLVQSALQSAEFPKGVDVGIGDERAELKQAEDALRRALDARPSFPEAQLRLGRVLGLRGRPADGVAELRAALSTLAAGDVVQQYYGQLFVAAQASTLARYDEARDAYAAAAAMFPQAQSPLLGLSELARRRGDRRSALTTMRQLFALPDDEKQRTDPWWTYHIHQARNADALLEELWKPYRQPGAPR